MCHRRGAARRGAGGTGQGCEGANVRGSEAARQRGCEGAWEWAVALYVYDRTLHCIYIIVSAEEADAAVGRFARFDQRREHEACEWGVGSAHKLELTKRSVGQRRRSQGSVKQGRAA
jgi:hypothetical protein